MIPLQACNSLVDEVHGLRLELVVTCTERLFISYNTALNWHLGNLEVMRSFALLLPDVVHCTELKPSSFVTDMLSTLSHLSVKKVAWMCRHWTLKCTLTRFTANCTAVMLPVAPFWYVLSILDIYWCLFLLLHCYRLGGRAFCFSLMHVSTFS